MNALSPPDLEFRLGKQIGKTAEFDIYACELPDDRACILKRAVSKKDNGLLDREAYLLRSMHEEALALEDKYAKSPRKKKGKMNYQLVFPNLVASFADPKQGGRMTNIMSFSGICSDISELVPLGHLASREHVYIDRRTSGWILGKLLKLLVFAHNQGIYLGDKLTSDNVLINREQHYVAMFDWSGLSADSSNEFDAMAVTEDVNMSAEIVIQALGGDIESSTIPGSEKRVPRLLADMPEKEKYAIDEYQDAVYELYSGFYESPMDAHTEFYSVVYRIWPRGFHPFTTVPIGR